MSTTVITNKIGSVSDNVCMLCSQMWNNECRAFEMSQSEEERTQRLSNPFCRCQKSCYDKTISKICSMLVIKSIQDI